MKQKNYNLELIRTLSFIMVVLIHVTNYFCRAYGKISMGEYVFSLTLDTVARFSVPCFFMMSGALLLGREEPLEKNGKRLLRFVVALVFWSLVYYFHNAYYMGTECSLSDILHTPMEQHLWYLYAMLPIYVVLPFFQIMCRGMDRKLEKVFLTICPAVVLLMYVMSFFDAEFYYDVPLLGDRVYSFYFFLGYYLYKYKDEIRLKNKQLVILFLAGNVANVILTAGISVRNGDHYERLLEYGSPLIILSSMAFFLFMLRIGNGEIHIRESVKIWIDRWNTCSFGIYLIHILFLDNFKKYVGADEVSAYWAVPVLTVGILLVSFLCIYLFRRSTLGQKVA